jgi:DNA polymerase III subunit epsilon
VASRPKRSIGNPRGKNNCTSKKCLNEVDIASPVDLPTSCNLLIIDTETTGLDPTVDRVVELAAILYSVEHQTILHQMSSICESPDNAAEHINRIPAGALRSVKAALESHSIKMFQAMACEANFLVAHNADFDKQWFQGDASKSLINPRTQQPLRWLCTMDDFTWPRQNKPGDSLINLALAHGIGVSSAHRALTDCQLIAALLDRVTKEELSSMLCEALTPRHLYMANVSFDNNQLAKNAGFKWKPERRMWVKKLTEAQANLFDFRVTRLSA